MQRQASVTCHDCYFRRAGLCALDLATPCPTFRPYTQGAFAPPPQPRVVPQLGRLAAQYAAAAS